MNLQATTNIEIQKEFSERLQIHKNLQQEVVVTTVDKLRICLMQHRDCLSAKGEWVAPASLLLSFATTLVAADFKKFILGAQTWQALYIFLSVGSAIWLLRAISRAFKNRATATLDNLVSEIKATTTI